MRLSAIQDVRSAVDRNLHPSLVRVYACPDEAYIAYFDETYTGVNETGRSFYAVTASIYRKEELEDLRADLIDIVDNLFNKGRPYWHTTKAIKRKKGKENTKNCLTTSPATETSLSSHAKPL